MQTPIKRIKKYIGAHAYSGTPVFGFSCSGIQACPAMPLDFSIIWKDLISLWFLGISGIFPHQPRVKTLFTSLLAQRYVSGKQHNQWKKRGFCFNSVITCCQIKLRFLGIMQNCLRNTKTISLMWVSVCVGMTSPNWLAAYHILFIFYHLAAFQCHATKT